MKPRTRGSIIMPTPFRIVAKSPFAARRSHGARTRGEIKANYASSRLNTSVALVPPKPNEFDSTVLSLALSMRLRTIECGDVGALADETVVHHQQRIDRFLHAGGAERVSGQRLGGRDRGTLVAGAEHFSDRLDFRRIAGRR